MLAHLSAAIVMSVAGFGACLGIALIGSKAVEGMARQPEASPNIRVTMIIAIAFVESIALYALVVAFMLLSK